MRVYHQNWVVIILFLFENVAFEIDPEKFKPIIVLNHIRYFQDWYFLKTSSSTRTPTKRGKIYIVVVMSGRNVIFHTYDFHIAYNMLTYMNSYRIGIHTHMYRIQRLIHLAATIYMKCFKRLLRRKDATEYPLGGTLKYLCGE